MKVLVWATTLQADILALALYLDGVDDVELLVVAEGVRAFRAEPIAKARPLRAHLLDRAAPEVDGAVRAFAADVAVFDNHFPPVGAAPRLCSMWHGLGWKARGRSDLDTYYRHVRRRTGIDPRKPNPRFLAQCYGEPDRRWRIEKWGLDPGACEVIGMAFSDLVMDPPYDAAALAASYEIDVTARKTALVSLTWHYGSRDGSRDGHAALLRALLDAAARESANLLLCLHDEKRYEPRELEALRALVAGRPNVQLKHKNEHPDNLADLLVADVMVSNLSSFITYFYLRGLPSVHFNPLSPDAGAVQLAKLRWGRVAYRRLGKREDLWMNAPDDNGGLLASDVDGAIRAFEQALREPDSCRERSKAWIERHVHRPDGHTCERFAVALRGFCARPL